MIQENLIRMYESSFKENCNLPALTDYFKKETRTYFDLAKGVAAYHTLFEKYGIRKGDKIALIGRNTPKWVMTYIATITYGAVIVPILQDFNPKDITNIVNHSDSRLLFLSSNIWESLDASLFEKAEAVIDYESNVDLWERKGSRVKSLLADMDAIFAKRYPNGFSVNDIRYPEVANDKVCIISYTSGTTGFSKGVMITVNNVTANVIFALDHHFHFKGSRVLGLLPLAHAYGCAFDMLTPLSTGSHVTLLGKTPTPKILLEAMKVVKPHLICTVPLVMEKIIRKQVFPKLEKNPLKTIVAIPGVNKLIYAKIRKQLLDAFGGCISEVNMGGAPLSTDVEDFLKKIKFPFTVGYGMTECAPLICYAHNTVYVPHSCGTILPGMEIKIDSHDPENVPGEICVRGENVMAGYYKNPEATAETIDSDGWLHTGDIGVVRPDGTTFIRGRCKSMILLGNGQNIYPEEIESKLNTLEAVNESLVVEEDGKLVALVVPDYEKAQSSGWSLSRIKEIMEHNLRALNELVAPYEKVANIKLCAMEFEKTPKRSIRRYLYPEKAKIVS